MRRTGLIGDTHVQPGVAWVVSPGGTTALNTFACGENYSNPGFPKSTEMVSSEGVFDAEEAARLFVAHHRTGDIPPGYSLRPLAAYTANHDLIDVRGAAPLH